MGRFWTLRSNHLAMIVKVKYSESSAEEMCIVEFQGEILGDNVGEMGTLEVKNGKVDMRLGQHTLVGKVVELKSPFLVMEKTKNEQSGGEETTTSTMSCAGVIKNKILFSTRPQPLRVKKDSAGKKK